MVIAMTKDQEALFARLVVAFEGIAQSLAGIHDTEEKEFSRRWPEPRPLREAVVTRVPTDEDLIREAHGASDEPIEEWIGFREQEFLARGNTTSRRDDAGATPAAAVPEPEVRSPQAAEDQSGEGNGGTTDYSPV